MRLRLPLVMLLCVSLVAAFSVPSAADGPVLSDAVSSQAFWASRAGSQPWQRTGVSGDNSSDLGAFVSVAVNPATGDTWVAFYDDTNDDLVAARYFGSGGNCGTDNAWVCVTVASTGVVGQYPSIAINATDGQPGIAYYDVDNDQLRYSHFELGWVPMWVTEIVEADRPSANTYTSLVYDSSGVPHISYHTSWSSGMTFSSGLAYAHRVGSGGNCGVDSAAGAWQCDTVTSGSGLFTSVGTYTSIALNYAGLPRIAYSRGALGESDLYYAYYVASGGDCGPSDSWKCVAVDTAGVVGQSASLSYASGAAEIAYYDATNGTVKYAKWYGGNTHNCGPTGDWQCDTIDDVGITTPPAAISLTVEGDGGTAYPFEPVIAYGDASGNTPDRSVLKVARPALLGNCGPSVAWLGNLWQCDTVDAGLTRFDGSAYMTAHNVGLAVSVATNGTGLATVVYRDASALDVLAAYQRYTNYLPLQLSQPGTP